MAEMGRFKDSEIMHRQALDGRKLLLGRSHPNMLASLHDMAIAVWGKGIMKEQRK